MANPGYVVPIGTQTKEGFHAIRRTAEGLLYYTKVNKDSGETLDFEGGSPSDPRGNKQKNFGNNKIKEKNYDLLDLNVTLDDIMNSNKKTIKYKIKDICSYCNGTYALEPNDIIRVYCDVLADSSTPTAEVFASILEVT